MKSALKRLSCLVLALLCFFTSTGALATTVNTAYVTVSSSQWEEAFLGPLVPLKIAEEPAFTVTEHPEYEAAYRYAHTLDLAGFMEAAYYDDGNGAFNSAILTINLDHGDAPEELAWLAMYVAVLAGDPDTTWQEFDELMNAMCPSFRDVFSGNEQLQGAQGATLRGVGYMIEVDDSARTVRLFTNATLTNE